ncbi:MAG: DUF5017 domain-containing protein [Bacteroidetes bacterium]|uniref:choice-of-anchor J domain-containing protein n=1 Tax=Flavobacterium sp. TaxID=239 RepID=UPI002FDB3BC4|nr:DUF5017 domain-containing protein [Bacteroidota bacterium]
MKNIFKVTLFLVFSLTLLSSCSKEDDYSIPPYKPLFFNEGFEEIPRANTGANQFITLEGWSNVSLNGGARKWEARYYSADGQYAQLQAFQSNETNMDTWLISPALNFDLTENEGLIFSYKQAFYNGQPLSVLISTNYDGSNTAQAINNATWTDMNVVLPDFLTTGYPSSFSKSEIIDLSEFDGTVYIAFRYKGSSSGISTTFQLDDIKLFENK